MHLGRRLNRPAGVDLFSVERFPQFHQRHCNEATRSLIDTRLRRARVSNSSNSVPIRHIERMGRHTPAMSATELANYLERHLGKELHWLLRAASEWHAQKHMQLKVNGYQVQTYAMDSTFLHARTLFEFFTEPTRNNYYGCDVFKVTANKRTPYQREWKPILHAFMMHAQDRSAPQKLSSYDGTQTKDLQDMPVDFAREIVRLWAEFTKALSGHNQKLGQRASEILLEAQDQAKPVLDNVFTRDRRIPPLTW